MPYQSVSDAFDTALLKHQERSEQYEGDDPWGNGGWKAQLVEMRKKLDRLWTYFDADEESIMLAEDDAIDLINYTAFFLILMERGDSDGTWPWPNEESQRPARTEPQRRQDPNAQRTAAFEAARDSGEQAANALRQFASSLDVLVHGWLSAARGARSPRDRAENVGRGHDRARQP